MISVLRQLPLWSRLLLLVWAFGGGFGCASTPDPASIEILSSGRTGVIVSFVRPRGLKAGAVHRAARNGEEWLLGGEQEGRPVELKVRISHPRDPLAWPPRAPDAVVANYWRDTFSNPTCETIGTFELAGQQLPLRRIRNVDGAILAIDPFLFDGTRLSISFFFDQNGDAEAWQSRFASFVGSLVVRRKAGVVIWKPSSRASSAES